MGEKRPVVLPVAGALDTSNPLTGRPPGTLLEATDVGTRSWGPRKGAQQVTGVHALGDTDLVGPGQNVLVLDGTGDYVQGKLSAREQRNLPTRWTLDIVFEVLSLPASGNTATIFLWGFDATDTFPLGIRLSINNTVSLPGKLSLAIWTTTTPDVTGTQVTITGSAVVPTTEHVHVRVVRSGSTVELYLNDVLDMTNSTLGATEPHESTTEGVWALGRWTTPAGTHEDFNGKVYRLLLRTGEHVDRSSGYHDFPFPKSSPVKLAVVGAENGSMVRDYSRFEAHGAVSGNPSKTDTVGAPYTFPVQGMAPFTDHQGTAWNVVVCGGAVYFQRAV